MCYLLSVPSLFYCCTQPPWRKGPVSSFHEIYSPLSSAPCWHYRFALPCLAGTMSFLNAHLIPPPDGLNTMATQHIYQPASFSDSWYKPPCNPRSLLRPFCGHLRRCVESAKSRALDAFLAVAEEFTQIIQNFSFSSYWKHGTIWEPTWNHIFHIFVLHVYYFATKLSPGIVPMVHRHKKALLRFSEKNMCLRSFYMWIIVLLAMVIMLMSRKPLQDVLYH